MIERLLARAPRLAALRDTPVVVACSGGADSLALLALAAQTLAPTGLHVVYVDHGLRDDTAHDFTIVEHAATRFGAGSVSRSSVMVQAGPNLEARARTARYAALEVARRERGCAHVVLGHTMDDQAETVLLALLRGSASAGLGAMAPQRDALVRPLLGIRRAETHALCAELGLVAVDDAMNHDARFRRVWVRDELMSMLAVGAARDVVPVLARQAEILRSEGKTVILVTHDIGEAVSMASRVIVMSRRPGRIKSEHRTDYPSFGPTRPKPFEARTCPEFNGYFQAIWDELDLHSIH